MLYVNILFMVTVYKVVGLYSKRMEVVHMNLFSFNDLMQFGIFLIALLTFMFLISHK